MMHWAASGADVGDTTDEVCRWSYNSAGTAKVDVFPFLVVGDGSFTTIGFQTDGKTVKFTTYHKPPGEAIADRHNPYGEVGFYSFKWYYGQDCCHSVTKSGEGATPPLFSFDC